MADVREFDEEMMETEVIVEEQKKGFFANLVEKHPKGVAIAATIFGTMLGAFVGVEIGTHLEFSDDSEEEFDDQVVADVDGEVKIEEF